MQRQACSAIINLTIDIIDLTDNIDHCGLCSNILGEGDKNIAYIYLFQQCECVICGECYMSSPCPEAQSCCSKYDHTRYGPQGLLRVYEPRCGICLETSGEKFDRISDYVLDEKTEQGAVICGHIFCHSCLSRWVASSGSLKCPTCATVICGSNGKTLWFGMKIIQRGIIS